MKNKNKIIKIDLFDKVLFYKKFKNIYNIYTYSWNIIKIQNRWFGLFAWLLNLHSIVQKLIKSQKI